MKKRISIVSMTSKLILAAALPALIWWPLSGGGTPGDREEQSVGSYAVLPADGYHGSIPVDWEAVGKELDAAVQSGEARNVDVLTGGIFAVPREILCSIAGKDVTLALQTGNGLAFSFAGKDVGNVDAKVELELSAQGIPETAKQGILTGTRGSYEFHVASREAFPIPMNVHLNFGEEGGDKLAVLYRYDDANGKLRFMGTFRMTGAGLAMFQLSQGGAYLAVAVERPATCTVAQGDTLSHIALRNGTTLSVLRAANPQIEDLDMIHPGQVINLY